MAKYIPLSGQLPALRCGWSDEAIARLVEDVLPRGDDYALLAADVRQSVEFTDLVKPSSLREMAVVDEIVQGDRVFMMGETEPKTVVYVHQGSYTVSLVVLGDRDDIPLILTRHTGGIVMREKK